MTLLLRSEWISASATSSEWMRVGLSRGRLERYRQNIVAGVQSPKTRSRRCCETMIFVLSSFIRLSEPISRGTVTGQRNSTTRLRVSCPTSRTSEHSSARGCDVRMFGCLPLDGPHREGGLLAGLRTYLPLSLADRSYRRWRWLWPEE